MPTEGVEVMAAMNRDLRVTVLDWLAGRFGCAEGERVLVRSFGGGYLGVIERCKEVKGGDYILRYYLGNDQECESARKNPAGEDEITFSQNCGKVIDDLILSGMIASSTPPPEHDGIAVYTPVVSRGLAA